MVNISECGCTWKGEACVERVARSNILSVALLGTCGCASFKGGRPTDSACHPGIVNCVWVFGNLGHTGQVSLRGCCWMVLVLLVTLLCLLKLRLGVSSPDCQRSWRQGEHVCLQEEAALSGFSVPLANGLLSSLKGLLPSGWISRTRRGVGIHIPHGFQLLLGGLGQISWLPWAAGSYCYKEVAVEMQRSF